MTPIIFHHVDLSASQVGQGLAAAALVGTVVRLLCGVLLDRGLSCSWPVRAAAVLALLADLVLLPSSSFSGYLCGQMLIGIAAGLYFPAIEFLRRIYRGISIKFAGASRAARFFFFSSLLSPHDADSVGLAVAFFEP